MIWSKLNPLQQILRCKPLTPRLYMGWVFALMLTFTACGGSTVDHFGGSQNHMHDLLALRGLSGVVLAATHYGLYRSVDNGGTWTTVAGGAGQPMDGLMIFRLAQDPNDEKTIYCLAIPRTDRPQDARSPTGVYASNDGGQNWHLVTDAKAFPDQTIYTLGIAPHEIFVLLPVLGVNGLLASSDTGAHWHALPATPDPHPQGIAGDPLHAGRLWMWSTSTGLYRSDDDGAHWVTVAGIQGGIFAFTQVGNDLYASEDSGIFRSTDDGASFGLAYNGAVFTSIVAASAAPDHLFALAGSTIERSTDGGENWSAVAPTHEHAGNIAIVPSTPTMLFAASSYPISIERTTDAGNSWQTVLAGP